MGTGAVKKQLIVEVMEIFNVAIKVHYEGNMLQEFRPRANTPSRALEIFYRLGHNGVYNHYDSVVAAELMQRDTPAHSMDNSMIDLTTDNKTLLVPPTIENSSRAKELSLTRNDNQPYQLDQSKNNVINLTSITPMDQLTHISSQNLTSNSQLALSITAHRSTWPSIRIGTWNVRGCNDREIRKSMDEYLSMQSFDIIAVQETKMVHRTCDTKHYKWILGMDNNDRTTARGLAFLVHVSLVHIIRNIRAISRNILICEATNNDNSIVLINVHIPLRNITSTHKQSKVIILGDFNAHIGNKDLTEDDKQYIGPNLYHDICNDNGKELKHLIHAGKFSVKNTWSKSPSIRTTWSNDRFHSQIDHFLCNSTSIHFRHTFGTRIHTVSTDHKLHTNRYISYSRHKEKFYQTK